MEAAGIEPASGRRKSTTYNGLHPPPILPQKTDHLRDTMARFEAWVLWRALERHGQRRIAMARSLEITRECLYK